MNSLVFLLIGLEIHVRQLLRNWTLWHWPLVRVLVGRCTFGLSIRSSEHRFAEKIPFRAAPSRGGDFASTGTRLSLSLPATFPIVSKSWT